MENACLVMALAIHFDFASLFLIPMVPNTAHHTITSCFLSDLCLPPTPHTHHHCSSSPNYPLQDSQSETSKIQMWLCYSPEFQCFPIELEGKTNKTKTKTKLIKWHTQAPGDVIYLMSYFLFPFHSTVICHQSYLKFSNPPNSSFHILPSASLSWFVWSLASKI